MTELPKNYEELQTTLSKENKIVSEAFSEIDNELKEKYGIEKHTRLNITKEELSSLIKNIKSSEELPISSTIKSDIKAKLKYAIYDEFIETNLENNGIKEISIDKISANVKNNKILESKKILNEYVDSFTKKYDFLGQDEKEIFKLVIANKVINTFSPLEMLNISKIITNIGEGVKKLDFTGVKDEANKVKTEFNGIQDKLQSILLPYEGLFNKVNTDISKYNNKQNIISNIAWFHNPEEIESYNGEELNFDYEKVKDLSLNTKVKNIEEVKQYLIKSKNKIENLGKQMEGGEKMKKFALNLINTPMVGGYIEGVLGFLLKIPFIGKLLSIFLGLNPDNPMESLNAEKETFATYKSIQSFGTKDNKENTDSKIKILKDKDLSHLDYEKLKPNLEYINSLSKNDKEIKNKDELIIRLFSKDGYKGLKLNIGSSCFTNKKANKDFYKIIDNSINKYKNEQRKKNNEKNLKEEPTQDDINKLSVEASKIKDIDGSSFMNFLSESIKQKDDILQFNSITIEELEKNKDNIEKLLIERLGEKDWSNEMKNLQGSLILFCGKLLEYKDKNKFKNIGDALNKKDEIIKDYKDEIYNKIKEATSKEKIKDSIININGDLKNGIEDNGIKIKLDGNILNINNLSFKIGLPNEASVENIILNTESAYIHGYKGIFRGNEEVDRELVNRLICLAIDNGKSEYITDSGKILIHKIT